MKDCKGNKLAVGQTVVFILRNTSDASLKTGVITKIYGNECSVDGHPHIFSHRILKLPDDLNMG